MSSERRKYTKRRRAEGELETRQRITEAAVALHGTIGPARTTISAVADRAGVQRATVADGAETAHVELRRSG